MSEVRSSTNGAEFNYPLSAAQFATIAALLHGEAGITLGPNKRDLVHGRLARRLRALGCPDFARYIRLVNEPGGEDERRSMINALTTNLTGFFREPHHFEFLTSDILPELVREHGGARRLRIWSAGCSSGEEPYSIAMAVHSGLPDIERWDARILATDIDTDMVAAGRSGRYEASRTERVPLKMRQRYLVPAPNGDAVLMAEALRSLISFKCLNLLERWPMQGPFDVIFCRNVVIYFDKETQRTLFDRYADLLKPGGWLFIGHSESLFHISTRFEHLGKTIYRKKH